MDFFGLIVVFLGLLAVQTAGQVDSHLRPSTPASTTWDRRDGIINIDDPSEEGASGHGIDDEDGSGKGDTGDTEDTEEGSADDPGLTPCRKLRQDLRNVRNMYIPQCRSDGSFERKQCHSGFKECWCVDIKGREITGTKMDENEFDQNCDFPVIRHPTVQIRLPTDPPRRAVPRVSPSFAESNAKQARTSKPTDPEEDNYGRSTDTNTNTDHQTKMDKQETSPEVPARQPVSMNPYENDNYVLGQPGILAGIIGGAVVGLLCAVLFVMFIVYRMRKKDEGSYPLDDQKQQAGYRYHQAHTKEYYA